MEAETETTYTFEQLSPKAKAAAIDAARYRDVNHDWWDYTYSDAKRIGSILGIQIDRIFFSGFSSQGDGACFVGRYRCAADALTKIVEECPKDAELKRIAEELTCMQVDARISYNSEIRAEIMTRGNYCHSGTMDVKCSLPEADDGPDADLGIDVDIIACMRRFADWIYDRLEEEHDYLTSDECVEERLTESDTEYDIDGAMI